MQSFGNIYFPSLKWPSTILVVILLSLFFSDPAKAKFSKPERITFQQSIIDRRSSLNPKFKKIRRKKTKYIIVHTAEAGLKSALNVISRGKLMRKTYRTKGGHAHYVIARNGRTYRILSKQYIADHAGKSMWNKETNISKLSIGIELVGYHYASITNRQYNSLRILIGILQRIYNLNDRAVLTHSQIAYGERNRWIKRTHRGRKKCAKNFLRSKAGLSTAWNFDPDVKAGRLVADPKLKAIFYGHRVDVAGLVDSNAITEKNTAWAIAGEDYDSPATLYKLPNGRVIPGDQIENRIGWIRIPKNTLVVLNQSDSRNYKRNQGPIKTISEGLNAWTFAGLAYKKKTTFYFLPNGQIKNGRQISDWDDLPQNTKMVVGYRRPVAVMRQRPPIKIAGQRYNNNKTLYYFPKKKLIPGNKINDFRRLPTGVLVFLPIKSS